MRFWPRKAKEPQVIVGGQALPVKPLGLEAALQLLLLLSPHLALIEEKMPQIQAALANTRGRRPRLLRAIFLAMREEMAEMPGDIMAAFGLLVDRDPAWLAEQGLSATDMIEALPVLDELNDFIETWQAAQGLGFNVRYKGATP